jgi:hypothetical protein
LAQINAALNGEKAGASTPARFRSLISEFVTGRESAALQRVLFGMSAVCRDRHVNVETVIAALDDAIQTKENSGDLQQAWASAKEHVEALLNSKSVVATSKAVELAFTYEHHYESGKIISDVRPVFDGEKENILGAVVNQSLWIKYADTSGNDKVLTLQMDDKDIEWLLVSCQEALKKSKTIKTKLESALGFQVITIGEINDGN